MIILKTKVLLLVSISLFLKTLYAQNLQTKFESSQGLETVTYEEGIAYAKVLAENFEIIDLQEFGTTDIGKPLHTLILSTNQNFDVESLKAEGKTIFLINNAIHPGEPDGVDASLMLLRDIAQSDELQKLVENTVLVVVPFYNIGGVLNRGSYSRANQNGPLEYGFRGNAQHLDLNRDFIKCDSENARTFTQIFQKWQPDVYIENHVTNGADYQYALTVLATQKDKLGGELGNYLNAEMMPSLEENLGQKEILVAPYVNVHGTPPDNGIEQFLDSPRYSSGYVALFHTMGFIVETHMLKPFAERVGVTYEFMKAMLEFLSQDGMKIQELRKETSERIATQKTFPIQWELNEEVSVPLLFHGYKATEIESEVTGLKRLYYDREKPYTKEIPFYNQYEVSKEIEKPIAYIIPQARKEVLELLKLNQLEIKTLQEDLQIPVNTYYIKSYQTRSSPYEGHYLHFNTEVSSENQTIQFYKGDVVVYANQTRNRYLIETLEPEAPDSFFNWNFFDEILQQKEYFSAYVFEEIALDLLAQNPELEKEFREKQANDTEFAADARAQLYFIYTNSPYYEKEHLRYPIFRLEEDLDLPLD